MPLATFWMYRTWMVLHWSNAFKTRFIWVPEKKYKRSTKEVQKKYKRSTKEVQKKGHKNEHEETQNPKEPKEPSFVPFTVGKMPWFFTFKIVKSYMSSWFNLCNSFSIAVVVVLALFLSVPMLIPW
jgi:hypothetical protein